MADRYAEVASATGIERVEVLHGHISEDTAYLQKDYPYGRQLRCQRRVWLERAGKGAHKGEYRLVTRTSNPKRGDDWNNAPKASTYLFWAVLYRKPDQGEDYLDWTGVGVWGPSPAADVRMHVSGIYDGLDEGERKVYDALVKISRKNSREWERWETEIIPRLSAYYREHGEFTEPADSMALGIYLDKFQHPAACAAVLLTEYPRTDADGRTVWACCESSIGRPCAHERA